MENIEGYCNAIWRLAAVYGEENIHDPRWRYVKAEDLFYTGEEEPIKSAGHLLMDGEDFRIYKEVGEQCETLRARYLDNIKAKLLNMKRKEQMTYARMIIIKMSDMGRRLPLTEDTPCVRLFRDFIVPTFYPQVADVFELCDINLSLVFKDLEGKYGLYPLMACLERKRVKNETSSLAKSEADIQTRFEGLFKETHRKAIPIFLRKLENEKVIQNKRYIHRQKCYLAKLIVYMQEKGIFHQPPMKVIEIARIFYSYLGWAVYEKSQEKNSVTERAIRKVENMGAIGLSEQEKKDFSLFCSVFHSN